MLKTIGLFVLLFLFVLIVRVLGKKKTVKDASTVFGEPLSNDQATDYLENVPAVQLHQTGDLSQFNALPVWFDFEPAEIAPAIYEGTFWEVEPQGEYIFYLAGDYSKNQKGHLNFTSASMVFTVLVSLEANSVDIMQHDGEGYQQAADHSGIDINEYSTKHIGELIDKFKQDQPVDPGYQQFISLTSNLPEGAHGNARLIVGDNWFTGEGMKLSLVYEEFRSPAAEGEQHRALWIECHCMREDQPLAPLLEHFIKLVNRYKAMPYTTISGATSY